MDSPPRKKLGGVFISEIAEKVFKLGIAAIAEFRKSKPKGLLLILHFRGGWVGRPVLFSGRFLGEADFVAAKIQPDIV